MEDILIRFWTDLVGRLTGPMTFRLILQPAMAMVYAVHDGVRDARNGRPAYFWSVLAHSGDRGPLLTEGAKAVARVITLGAVMDATYQNTSPSSGFIHWTRCRGSRPRIRAVPAHARTSEPDCQAVDAPREGCRRDERADPSAGTPAG